MTRVSTYHHVTHNVSRKNLTVTLEFYGTHLGLVRIPSTEDPTGQRLIWYAVGTQQLHLAVQDTSDPATSRHTALIVEGMDALVAALESSGVRLDTFETDGRRESFKRRRDGSRSAFCYDPDGNRIELIELHR
jgi:catechol 2,3-dioxygenase-like lactoylglutathione lyase family enzyme